MKTNKSYSKRIKVTKNGKVIARKPGHGHFNAKESGSEKMAKKRSFSPSWGTNPKVKKRFLSNIK
ncbi:MAG: ribosomal protein L35 [Candidatus Paceibacteria bacterium]|jgi:ribosomal protein L35